METLKQIIEICESKQIGPSKMDRKHVILHCNETLQMIKELAEKELLIKA